MTFQAFHRSADRKRKTLDQIGFHVQSKEVVPGPGFWDGSRGSIMGVAAHSTDDEEFERQLGVPRGLLPLVERLWRLAYWKVPLHMNMESSYPEELVGPLRRLPQSWLEAIEPGSDVGAVPAQLLLVSLERVLEACGNGQQTAEVRALLEQLIGFHRRSLEGVTTASAEWRALRKQAMKLSEAAPVPSLARSAATITATAAWPSTPTGGLAADVIEADIALGETLAQQSMNWTGDEEALRSKLHLERDGLLNDMAKRRQAGGAEPEGPSPIRAYDDETAAKYPEFTQRKRQLVDLSAKLVITRLAECQARLISALQGVPAN